MKENTELKKDLVSRGVEMLFGEILLWLRRQIPCFLFLLSHRCALLCITNPGLGLCWWSHAIRVLWGIVFCLLHTEDSPRPCAPGISEKHLCCGAAPSSSLNPLLPQVYGCPIGQSPSHSLGPLSSCSSLL